MRPAGHRMCCARGALVCLALLGPMAIAGAARADTLVADLSKRLVAITTGFAGTDVLLFGAIDGEGDVVVVVRGPEKQVTMHRKSRVPVLAIIGQTGVAGVNERVFPMYRLGVNLSVPLWDGGRAVSLAHAADARALELDARARDARLRRNDEREQASIEQKNAEQQLTLAESLVAISEKRVDQAEASYDLGAGDLESVADARAALRDAHSRRIQLQVTRADAILRLGDSGAQ